MLHSSVLELQTAYQDGAQDAQDGGVAQWVKYVDSPEDQQKAYWLGQNDWLDAKNGQ